MALETFAPDQWAQELTSGHYQAMLDAGWPDEAVQQCANTLFNFCLLSGQLLMQEQTLTLPGESQEQPGQTIELTEDLAGQIMDYFAETIAAALQLALQMGLPADVRQRVIEQLAEDVYTYSKQVAASVMMAKPVPPREELSQLLRQTAQDALSHYLAEYEKVNGPIQQAAEPIVEQAAPPAPEPDDDDDNVVAHLDTPPPEAPQTTDAAAEDDGEPQPASSPSPPAPTSGPINLKLGAIALLLKSLPATAHDRVLRLFPRALHADINAMAADDAWMAQVDPVDLNRQLQTLKQTLAQAPEHPSNPLISLLRQVPWSAVVTVLKAERPVWLQFCAALKQGDTPEMTLPAFMQQELLTHLSTKLSGQTATSSG